MKKLKTHGIGLKSLQEPWLDISEDGMGELLIAIFSWVAKQERMRISERTKEGLKKAKNVGKRGKDKKKRDGYTIIFVEVVKEGKHGEVIQEITRLGGKTRVNKLKGDEI